MPKNRFVFLEYPPISTASEATGCHTQFLLFFSKSFLLRVASGRFARVLFLVRPDSGAG